MSETLERNIESKGIPSGVEDEETSSFSRWQEAAHDVEFPEINVDKDFFIAKSYLQKISCRNETMWDHLSDIIHYVLSENPSDCMRYFEDLSREIRMKKVLMDPNCRHYYELREEPKHLEESKKLLKFYRKVECFFESEAPYEDVYGTLDFRPTFKLLEDAGIKFEYSEVFKIQMGIRLLGKRSPIAKLKFWGKVLGTVKNYYIVEAELTEEGDRLRLQKFKEMQEMQLMLEEKVGEEQDMFAEPNAVGEEQQVEQPKLESPEQFIDDAPEEAEVPQRIRQLDLYLPPPVPEPEPIVEEVIPPEAPGEGPNKKVYYVTNDPWEKWEELPDVTPQQIVTARRLLRFMTGNLTDPVPNFPGTEKEFLRTQIARITAGTHISPLGYYTLGGEEEAVELAEGQMYVENLDYIPLPIRDLLHNSLQYWVHHEPYITKQGRVQPWEFGKEVAEEEAEEEMEEEKMTTDRENIPRILTPLSHDETDDGTKPWSPRRASDLLGDETTVVMRSNVWPGAVTALKDRLFVNFYFGWANKAYPLGFHPVQVIAIMNEYKTGPEIIEMDDPTVDMEEEWWLKHHRKQNLLDEGEGEEEGEEEEEKD